MDDLCPSVESDDVAALRWEALKDFGHDQFVDQLLGLGGPARIEQFDRSQALHEILGLLKFLCGSEDAARRWLFRESYFSEAAGCEPYVSLENDEFWPMQVMLDWLKVFEKIHKDSGASFPELFPGD